jgi:N-acetylmuramoyl-L-alanine amidase
MSKRFKGSRLGRFTLRGSALTRWWWSARIRLSAMHRDFMIFVSIVGAITVAFGALFYALFTQPNDRPSLSCLALNVYFEARGEPLAGQYAVAEVTMNRVASGRYPATVCGVVHEKRWDSIRGRYVSAFSWTEFGDLPTPKGREWQQAVAVAKAVYYGKHKPTLNGALHYHATYVEPSWSKGEVPVARIGKHLFYNNVN